MVVQNVLDYINEGLRQLSDPKFYIETEEDLTHTHTLDINAFLDTMWESNEVVDKCHDYLRVSKERTSLFYMLPKIHKKSTNPPGSTYCFRKQVPHGEDFSVCGPLLTTHSQTPTLLCQRHDTFSQETAEFRTYPSRKLLGDHGCCEPVHQHPQH